MKILVLNCGSSSLKYQLMDMENEKVLAKGNYERIGQNNSFLTHKVGDKKHVIENPVKTHDLAIKLVIEQLLHKEYGVIKSLDEISAIGHRVVHGGEKFTESVLIDEDVKSGIEDAVRFAPLHNPAGLLGIGACEKELPGKPNIAVFDTAFHQTMPKEHYIYPIAYKYYEEDGIRKYGFHGTSHKFISKKVAELYGKDKFKLVSCHLGQGASLCAIKDGKSVDTSMGLTPLAGIPMGTRCGDIDPSILIFLMEKYNLTTDQLSNILNKESGAGGLSGVSPDFRDMETAMLNGDERAKLALDNYSYLVAQYIARYAVSLNGIDVITFCAGVGENDARTRWNICERLEFLGVKIDKERNNTKSDEREISTKDSKIKVYIIPTDEELMIARETKDLVK